jgi:hypothetical protein
VQLALRSMSIPVSRRTRAATDSIAELVGAGGGASRARHRASLARRVRLRADLGRQVPAGRA